MADISELARSVGLSRSALLYYEKRGLLKGRRGANGYRVYDDADRQRLRLLQQLQAGGLSLDECQACLDGRIDRDRLSRRFDALQTEVEMKQRALRLLSALLGHESLKTWHEEVERLAPDLHRQWLMTQGFSSEDAARVTLLSKDMNDHDDYMAAFLEVFSTLDYWGPGSPETTRRALSCVPFAPQRILDVGCGNGVATLILAAETLAHITAIDTEDGALARLTERAAAASVGDRVEARHLDMVHLPELGETFDLLWAEGSAYVIGVERALKEWRALLQPGGALVVSDMVWRTEQPADEVRGFWASEYPAMTTVAARLEQARAAGYRVLSHFDMGPSALEAYYGPLEARVREVENRMPGQRALEDLRRELRIHDAGRGQFGYEMFVLARD